MLKFWKKAGQKEKTSGSPNSSGNCTPTSHISPLYNGGFPSLSWNPDEIEELMKESLSPITGSRLSKTLVEVLNDTEALGYFIQYLEAVGCAPYVKCMLDIDSFAAATAENIVPRTENEGIVDEGCGDGAENQSNTACEEHVVMSQLLAAPDVTEVVTDAVKIFQQYFSFNSPLRITLPAEVYSRLVQSFKSDLNQTIFSEAKFFILALLDKEHFNEFLRSEFHCKYQIDVLTSSKVLLSDILFNDTALFYLMEFLEQEGWRAGLEFWMSACNFQQQYKQQDADYDPMQAQGDAMILYDKYFSLQATSPLGLGDAIRLQVEESICREEGPLPSCFEASQGLIVRLLERRFLEPFLHSQLYCKYLSELITTIQASPALCSRSKWNNSAGSDCSSEVSISMTNTLLVSEDVNPPSKKILKNLSQGSMSIDARQLYDPDSLWRRGSKRLGLSFGRINELGRFETELEPEPDRKEESRIAKAVKKLVNIDEDKSKEEMAWQVAAMIVKDVTNVTLATPSSNS